jgi:hypothetical protein
MAAQRAAAHNRWVMVLVSFAVESSIGAATFLTFRAGET